MGLGLAFAVALLAVIVVRIYQDRPQPQPWAVAPGFPDGAHRGEIPPTSKRLLIVIDSGQCNPRRTALTRVEVDEEPKDVTITAYVDPPGSPFAVSGIEALCLSYLNARVELDEPLGSRTLHVGGFDSVDPRGGNPGADET